MYTSYKLIITFFLKSYKLVINVFKDFHSTNHKNHNQPKASKQRIRISQIKSFSNITNQWWSHQKS